MKKTILFIFILTGLAGVLHAQDKKTGGDRDKHGCTASAGYTWSVIKNECVRLFEQDFQLAGATPANEALQATIIFSKDRKKAELFMAGIKGSVMLIRSGNKNFYKKGDLILSKGKVWTLKKGNKIIYRQEGT